MCIRRRRFYPQYAEFPGKWESGYHSKITTFF